MLLLLSSKRLESTVGPREIAFVCVAGYSSGAKAEEFNKVLKERGLQDKYHASGVGALYKENFEGKDYHAYIVDERMVTLDHPRINPAIRKIIKNKMIKTKCLGLKDVEENADQIINDLKKKIN